MSSPSLLGYRSFPFQGEGTSLRLPVILLRGLGRSSGFWLNYAEELSQWGEIIAFDLLGTGQSPNKFGRQTIGQFASDLHYSLKHFGFQHSHLVGISLGGMVCMKAASSPTSMLASLTVMSASAGFTKETRLNLKAGLTLFKSLRNLPPKNQEFAKYLVAERTLQRFPNLPEVWDEVWKNEGFAPAAVINQLFAAACFHGKQEVSMLTLPTCYMVGGADALVSWKNSQRFWEATPGSKLVVFEGDGHDFPTENPKEVATKQAQFLLEVESRMELGQCKQLEQQLA